MLAAYRSCPQQFWLSYVRRITSAGRNPHFNAGGAFAKGLEVARRIYCHMKDEGTAAVAEMEQEALHGGLLALTKAYGDYEPGDKYRNKTWDRVATAFISYLEKYPLSSDMLQVANVGGKHMVEFSFAIPFPVRHPTTGNPIIYAGRLDWIARYKDQGLFAVDEKTTKSFAYNWASQWALRAQLIGYTYACQDYGIPVVGSVVRGTALLLTEIQHNQSIMLVPQWKLDRWKEQAIDTMRSMVQSWEDDYWRWDYGSSCTTYGGCQFQDLCNVKEPEPWMAEEAGLFVPNTWNPLERKDEED
ncbi:MAG TPA: PD-(D/E)XK nuclease family protein [Nitrospiraceae bacterium]